MFDYSYYLNYFVVPVILFFILHFALNSKMISGKIRIEK